MASAGKQLRKQAPNQTCVHRRAGVRARGGSRLTNQVSNNGILRGSTPLCLAERLAENCSSLAIFGYVFDIVVPPHGKTNLVKAFIINYLKQLIFQKAVLKAVHRQTKTLYEYSTLRSDNGNRT